MPLLVKKQSRGKQDSPKADLSRSASDLNINHGLPVPTHPRSADLPKSASYTYLPTAAKENAYTITKAVVPAEHASLVDSAVLPDSVDLSSADTSGWTTPSEDTRQKTIPVSDLAAHLEKVPDLVVGESSSASDHTTSEASSGKEVDAPSEQLPRLHQSFAQRVGRRMSMLSSRSPSPSKPKLNRTPSESPSQDATPQRPRSLLRKQPSTQDIQSPPPDPDKTSRRNTITPNNKSDQKATSTKRVSGPSRISLPKSFSTDRLHSLSGTPSQDDSAPLPSPRMLNAERNSSRGSLALPKKRDELWSVFRQLDADYTKFSSKSTPFKANVVRQSLLPFLRNHAHHPSNRIVRAEDLDRRTIILNKWWTGLLELLHGKNNQSLSGTDRPTILDAISGIMDRPEWRSSNSPFAPLASRAADGSLPRAQSTTSLASVASDFLTETVMHNVRNLYIQNLNNQMSFVTEKMSLRNASASLVTFCGKAIAYAFMFCPGVADALIRLWHLDSDVLKRVLREHDVEKFENLGLVTAHISAIFPPAVQNLGFVSLTKTMRMLRQPSPLPVTAAKLQWYGFWFDRWLGRDSDLLYVFVKHYFILANDFIAPEASKKEQVTAPGMLLVQAQLLITLDSTIHRSSGNAAGDSASSNSPSFDDFLEGPDAVVSSIPVLPPNAIRTMSENRVIMLLRDVLGNADTSHGPARGRFALAFSRLLSASTKQTSLYDEAACFTLCDFLQEALIILVRYEQLPEVERPMIDGSFWVQVFGAMMQSQHTGTEVRLYTFLYTNWQLLCATPERRKQFCMELLLEPEVFNGGFTHWCPMVRAYFMRLICWRLSRYDGGSGELDLAIVSTLFIRLRSLWSNHLYSLRPSNLASDSFGTSTAPCHPAPGRRFLIVRTDSHIAPGSSFLAFNGIMPGISPASSNTNHVGQRRILSTDPSADRPLSTASTDSYGLPEKDADATPNPAAGLRGFLRGILGGGSTSRKRSQSRDAKSPAASAPSTPSPQSPERKSDTDRQRPRDRASAGAASRDVSRGPVSLRQNRFTFKFTLDFAPRPTGATVVGPMRDMRLAPPRLPLATMKALFEAEGTPDPARPEKPERDSGVRLKYVGRALAEWTLVVAECQGFFERRKGEGVPSDAEVETPGLAVEVFRRVG